MRRKLGRVKEKKNEEKRESENQKKMRNLMIPFLTY